MRRDRARFGVFLHLVYLLVVGLYCINIFNSQDFTQSKPQVLSATSYYDESTGLLNEQELEVYRLVNEKRREAGVPELKVNPNLIKIAQSRAEDMVNLSYYDHESPDGKYYYDLLDENYTNVFSCENLELEFSVDSKLFVDKWLASEKHRDCLLSPEVSDTSYAIREMKLGASSTVSTAYVLVAINSASSN